jgi:hypothetical protein
MTESTSMFYPNPSFSKPDQTGLHQIRLARAIDPTI